MTVFIGTKEISNWIHLYAKAFEANGDTVITCAEPHPFYEKNYTYNLGEPEWLYRSLKSNRFNPIESIRFRLAKMYRRVRQLYLLWKYSRIADVFVFVGDGLISNSSFDFRYIKSKGKKIVHIFYGGDVRDWDAFGQKYNIDVSEIEDGIISGKDFDEKVYRLRKSELYADALLSVEDQGVLALRPFHKLLIPFEKGKCKFVVNNRAIPIIVHIESRRPYKGEKFIYKAIEKLKEEGLQFEFRIFKGLSHEEVYRVLEDADILVDEVMIFGPGTLGHEAISCGCALATKMQADHFLTGYVCDVDYDRIVEPLKRFIVNREERVQNIYKCYELLRQNTSPEAVARHIISKLAIDKKDYSRHDYFPNFVYREYLPPNEHVLSRKAKCLTAKVVAEFVDNEEVRENLKKKGLI